MEGIWKVRQTRTRKKKCRDGFTPGKQSKDEFSSIGFARENFVGRWEQTFSFHTSADFDVFDSYLYRECGVRCAPPNTRTILPERETKRPRTDSYPAKDVYPALKLFLRNGGDFQKNNGLFRPLVIRWEKREAFLKCRKRRSQCCPCSRVAFHTFRHILHSRDESFLFTMHFVVFNTAIYRTDSILFHNILPRTGYLLE